MTERRAEQLTQADLSQRFGETEEGQCMNQETITDALRDAEPEVEQVTKIRGYGVVDTAARSAQPFMVFDPIEIKAASGSSSESSGGDNDYWLLHIAQPKRKELKPYTVECEDIIEAFEMTFQEGEAFKAIWRKCGQRMGNGKPGNTALRDAEKVAHFGRRMVTIEQRKL